MSAFRLFRVLAALALASGLGGLAAETLTVQIRDAAVYEKASSLSKSVGSLPYTTAVTVLQKSGAWTKISCASPKLTGWIQSSALSAKNLALKAGSGGSSGASGSEVALAGKGFSDEVEQEYRGQNPGLDYAEVDAMEGRTVSGAELAAFAADGPQEAAQ